jgi:hypothetical protein
MVVNTVSKVTVSVEKRSLPSPSDETSGLHREVRNRKPANRNMIMEDRMTGFQCKNKLISEVNDEDVFHLAFISYI